MRKGIVKKRAERPVVLSKAAVEFAQKNSANMLLAASVNAAGPMESAIFKALAINAEGEEIVPGKRLVPCVPKQYVIGAAKALQKGGIPEVSSWVAMEGIEVPTIAEIEAAAEVAHPKVRARLLAIKDHLLGATEEEIVARHGIRADYFARLYGSFRQFGIDAHYLQVVDSLRAVPKRPPQPRKPRVREERIVPPRPPVEPTVPVYPRASYEAPVEQLKALGLSSAKEMVDRLNARLMEGGGLPISVSDFPSSKRSFERLVRRWQMVMASVPEPLPS
ncbi:hypothetical protein GOA89_32565 [Sinorhizobium meliloti]|nr:hypothetical protein [Sinorhizobium meliloti]MDW9850854.1 hypothetical protein [Sinorhizobium meliloti]MDX0147652.1 hypothetical protein [Sinorhizobium meliloti]MDX0153921.1 hypothetical protein [Sinorhizobium meliloti]MDX0172833.1 hypothetical protein [Sinorhizobium meliloti]